MSVALVPIKGDKVYFYIYDDSCILPQSIPDIVIPEDNLSGVGAWVKTDPDGGMQDVISEGLFVRSLEGWVQITEPKDGLNGTVWYSGDDVPSSSIGLVNDFYFDEANSDIYRKSLPIYDPSNIFTGGFISSDTVNSINSISRAVDDSDLTFYQSSQNSAAIRYNFGDGISHVVTKIRIFRRVDDIRNIEISGSNDGVTLTQLYNDSISNDRIGWIDIEFYNDIPYQYIHIDIIDTYSTEDVVIYEMEAYKSPEYDWEFICNVRGIKGSSGSNWIVGDHATPLDDEGRPGDFYLYETLFNVFRKDIATYEVLPSYDGEGIAIFDENQEASLRYFTTELDNEKAISKFIIDTLNVSKLYISGSSDNINFEILYIGIITVDGTQTYEFVNTKQYKWYRFAVIDRLIVADSHVGPMTLWEATLWEWRSLGTIKGNDGYGLMEGIVDVIENTTIDFDLWQHKNIKITDNINITLSFPRGGIYSLKIHQDDIGGRVFTFTNVIHWLGGIEPGWITTPNSYCIISFRYDGVTIDAIGDVYFGEA